MYLGKDNGVAQMVECSPPKPFLSPIICNFIERLYPVNRTCRKDENYFFF